MQSFNACDKEGTCGSSSWQEEEVVFDPGWYDENIDDSMS